MARKGVKMPFQHFYYLRDREFYRVWRNDWSGDQFEVLDEAEFEALSKLMLRFSIPMFAEEDVD